MADVYIALSHHAADEMGIVVVWFNYVCLIKSSGSCIINLKTGGIC
jgi:hypothetical protein